MVERRTVNPYVASSSLAGGANTTLSKWSGFVFGNSYKAPTHRKSQFTYDMYLNVVRWPSG
ncbi:hypothetical protein VCHA53O466_40166 [Vibrio chagasii]|nr:hypothetical protein VCHA53O466_40166 [Vibrio chagasii]